MSCSIEKVFESLISPYRAYSDLNEVAHVRHTADCIQHFDSCS